MFRKNQFFSNIFTFLSIIRQNFEDNRRILANFGKFSHKNSKIYGFCPNVFKKTTGFFFFVFFNKDYTFYTKNLFIRPKNCVQTILYNERCKEFRKNQFSSNIFTFLIVTHQNFEDNLRILANFEKFSRKNSKIYLFRPYVSEKVVFFVFFNKDYAFYTKNLFIRPKNWVQIIFYNERCKEFRKINFLVKFYIFKCNTPKFWVQSKNFSQFWKMFTSKLKNLWISPIRFQKTTGCFFFVFFNKDYTFYTKNLFIRPKNCVQSIFYNERWKKFHKNQFFSNIFTFLSVTR